MNIEQLFKLFNEAFTLFFIFPGMILLGLYLTFQLKGAQVFKLKHSFSQLLQKKKGSQGNISHFEAISTVLAGNFGTGNISGMAIAVSSGGPGALVWMWVMAFFGAIIQYASCVLGVKYRTKNENGEFVGGPMYYLSQGLGYHKLAILFSVLTLIASVAVGNFAQINSMTLPLKEIGIHPLLSSLLITGCVAAVLIGGMQRMAKFASFVIPVKAFLYLGIGLIILFLNSEKIFPAFKLMFESAFDFSAATGGILGAGLSRAITTGFDRGIFATDAGTGIVPILQSGARTTHPAVDGLVTLVAPFMVMIICTMTGLILLISGAWQQPDLQSTNMVTYAFKEGLGSSVGSIIVIVALLLFGYTTILAWACCAEKAAAYLWGTKRGSWFKYFYVLLTPIGLLVHVNFIWTFADICITAMLATNMIGIALLSREVITSSRDYFAQESKSKQKKAPA